MKDTSTLSPGDRVHYNPEYGRLENGVVKSIKDEKLVWVVYKCGGEWNNYYKYTAALTAVERSLPWMERRKISKSLRKISINLPQKHF